MTRGLMKTASGIAIAAAAGLFATSAMAADLGIGGNCCADLEERVAELEATTARKGNRKVSLTIYGQITKSILWHDDEYGYNPEDLMFRDPTQALSRFGFRGEATIRPDLTAGYHLEIGLNGEDYGVDSGDDTFQLRHSYVYLDHQTLGRITLGQTSTVTDSLWQISLANTMVLPGEMGEERAVFSKHFRDTFAAVFDGDRRQGIYYRTPSLAGFMLSAGYFTNSYQTGGTSWDFDDADEGWDIALRYAGEFNGVRVAAGIGYREEMGKTLGASGGVENEIWMGSASVMHVPTGLFLSGGYADRDSNSEANEKSAWWLQAGIEKNWFGIGNTTIFGEYAQFDYDHNVAGLRTDGNGRAYREVIDGNRHLVYDWTKDRRDGNYWGLGIVQTIDAAAVDLFLNFRRYEVDSVMTDYDGFDIRHSRYDCGERDGDVCTVGGKARDASVIQAGMRIQF